LYQILALLLSVVADRSAPKISVVLWGFFFGGGGGGGVTRKLAHPNNLTTFLITSFCPSLLFVLPCSYTSI